MSKVDVFVKHPAEWLRSAGPEHDIVVSSRIRLARNIANFPFQLKLKPGQRQEIIDLVAKALKKSNRLKDAYLFMDQDLSVLDRQFLLERHLISRELADEKMQNAVAITPNEVVSLMVLEEDHLRLQVFQAGFDLVEAWRVIDAIDDEIGDQLQYAFSPSLGFLTACPTNVGTGLRASCMLHLPSLVWTKQVQKVLQALAKLNLAARGLYGEGTQATGNFFQFSNQMTMGQPEEEIIENLASVIRQVIEHEKEAREYLREKKRAKIEDQIWRALGVLKSARMISSSEATQLLSMLDLGMHMKFVDLKMSPQEVNALFLLIQPAHLQKLAGRELSATERDLYRSEVIRGRLEKVKL